MKLAIKKLKPRNPLVAAAKLRQAGAHGSYESSRRTRRAEKHTLHLLLTGRKQEGENA